MTKENTTVTPLRRLPSAARLALALTATLAAWLSLAAGPAAAAEPHPFLTSFDGHETPAGSLGDPNGLAVERSTGDVYVADIANQVVDKFTASGAYLCQITGSSVPSPSECAGPAGSATPAGSFEFPNVSDNPAALALDNSTDPSDPSAGDLYVLDAGHRVIDKFSPAGAYLGQITGPTPQTYSELFTEPVGLGIAAGGNLRVFRPGGSGDSTDVFDNSLANDYLKTLELPSGGGGLGFPPGNGFAVGSAADDYSLSASCGCIEKFGPRNAYLGRVDNGPSDLALAADPATGHLYLDEGSAVAEWDTGQMNGVGETGSVSGSAALVSSFGSAQLATSGQGGIAVDPADGKVYVSNPADGKVYVFATEGPAPAVAFGSATDLTKTTATLNATVAPRRGVPVSSCLFEYGEYGTSSYEHTVPCDQAPAQIGSGTAPVPVSAHLSGLQPGLLYRFRLLAADADGSAFASGRFATAGPGFGVRNLELAFANQDGTPDTQAGSHPYQMSVTVEFNTTYLPLEPVDSRYQFEPDGNLRDVFVTLPPGLVGDPNATEARCTLSQLASFSFAPLCPAASFIGYLEAELGESTSGGRVKEPLFNMVPPHGVAAQFGAHFIIPNAYIDSELKPGGDYGILASSEYAAATAPVIATRTVLFGVPPNSLASSPKPLLTLPTHCTGPLRSSVSADSYQEPGHFVSATALTRRSDGSPGGLTGCSRLEFPPQIAVSPDVSNASSASGLEVNVHVPQRALFNPTGLAGSNLRAAKVTLPQGMTLNPSGADGQEGCSQAQAGFTGFTEFNPDFEPGVRTATFTPTSPASLQPGVSFCPSGSKVGTALIRSPLLPDPLEGAVYLAAPYENPFGSLLALYLIVEDPVSGTLIKLVGEVSADPQSGQLVSTFKQNPDDPFEDLTIHFFGGNRAPLVTPALCGTYTTTAVFTPWDGNADVDTSSSFPISAGTSGGPCPSGGAPPFHPGLEAGTRSNRAGSYSPLDLELSRGDAEQEITHFSLKLPPGLIGKLAGIPLCSDAQIAAAKARTGPHGGAEEQEHPSCPAASQIGTTQVGAGVGSLLVWTPGKLYLAGSYHGSPLSVVSITPARVGAFDLGTVVVREAVRVNPETAEVFVDATGSDPLPHIIQGIPTHLRKILVYLDRPEFTLNPTSCKRMSIASTVLGSGADFTSEADDQPLTVTSPFQAADCAALPFHPTLKLRLRGKTRRGANPALRAEVTQRPGEASIGRAQVTLPHSEFLDNAHIGTVCTRVQFNQGKVPGEQCPAASVYGHARAITPLLSEPLEGPVFLRSSEHKLPDLVAALHGQEIDIDLVGRIDSVKGQIRNSFETVPDAPVSKFVLEMAGGKKSLLVNSTNLCAGTHRAIALFTAHNGKIHDFKPVLAVSCGKHGNKQHKAHGSHHR